MTRTILIVDDEFDLANTLCAILQAEGYSPEVYADGRQAMERLKTTSLPRPELVLMDIMMPRIGGLDVLRMIRSTPGLDSVPVILMSVITPNDSTGLHWDAFLPKPFSLQDVVHAVQKYAVSN